MSNAGGFLGLEQRPKRSEIQNGLEKINRRSGGEIGLKPDMNPRVLKRACRVRFGFDNIPRQLWEVGNAFVRYRYQERSSIGVRRRCVVDRQLKAGVLIEPHRKLSQHERSARQNGKAEEAEKERCD